MVCSGVGGERERVHDRESMAMGTERSKPLHNFTLPCLRWGSQKHLRCKKVESSAAVDRRSSASRLVDNSPPSAHRWEADYDRKRSARDSERRTVKVSKSKIDGDDGIEAVREKLMFDLKTAADKMKDAILREEAADDDPIDVSGVPPSPAPAPADDARPWNLRTRRAACKAPLGGDGGGKGVRLEERTLNYSPLRSDGGGAKSPQLRGAPEKRERPKFSVSLSKKDIEDDYMAMLGERPPRRPKKRPKNVQKQLDSVFPGLWLTEVSEDMYKVSELPETGKR